MYKLLANRWGPFSAAAERHAMSAIVLYHFPGACSQVTRVALDEARLDYELRLVDLGAGAQTSPEYLHVAPQGKVPAMLIDGQLLTENVALLTFIAESRPQAGLFPSDSSPWAAAQRMSGLSFCSGTLHPIVRGILNPSRLTDGDGEPVRAKSGVLATKAYGYAENRLSPSGWWLGQRSIIDVYLAWTVSIAKKGGFDLSPWPMLDGLGARLAEWPTFSRVLEDDARLLRDLESARARAPTSSRSSA